MMRKQVRARIGAALLAVSCVCLLTRNFKVPIHHNFSTLSRLRETKPEDLQLQRYLNFEENSDECEWVPNVHVDQDASIFATLLTAFPGSGKRVAFMQLGGLTGLVTGDDFNLDPEHLETKFAFLKTSFPHHESIWSWKGKADQAIYLIRNPRWALVDYQHLLHEIFYTQDWEVAYANLHRVYTIRPPIEDWIQWREERFIDEIEWWRWQLDYWMEGGLLRDIFTHEYTTPGHYNLLLQPIIYRKAELQLWQKQLPPIDEPYYDFHCGNETETSADMFDCKVKAVASFERLIDPNTGPEEVQKLSSVIEGREGITFIAPEKRECMWRKLITEKVSDMRDYRDRQGPEMDEYVFTVRQMELIIIMLSQTVAHYSSPEWIENPIARDIVTYMEGYISENNKELALMRQQEGRRS